MTAAQTASQPVDTDIGMPRVASGRVRVLHVVGSLTFGGGIESWLLNVLRSYDRSRFQFDLCYTGPEPGNLVPSLEGSGVEVVGCRMTLNYLPFLRRFARMLVQRRYAAVHAHLQNFAGPIIHAATQARVPIRVAHYHNTREGHRNDWKRRLYLWPLRHWIQNEATHIVGCSRAALAHFYPDLCHRNDRRLRVVYCGIRLAEFRDGTAADGVRMRSELGIPTSAPVIGHVGRFAPQKNHAGLVEIASRVLAVRPDARFVLVGDGALRPEIERLVDQRGMRRSFTFLGNRRDIPQVLKAMDVFVFPSLWEGFGIVLVEAQAAGVPVVAADIPGVSEAVVGPSRALLFRQGNWAEAAGKVLHVIEHRDAIGREMTRMEEELGKFDIQRSMDELHGLYSLA